MQPCVILRSLAFSLLWLMPNSCDALGESYYAARLEREIWGKDGRRERRGDGKPEGRWRFCFQHTTWNNMSFLSYPANQKTTLKEVYLTTSYIPRFLPFIYSWVAAGVRGHGCLCNPWATMQRPQTGPDLFWNSHSRPPRLASPCPITPLAPPLAPRLRPSMRPRSEQTICMRIENIWSRVMLIWREVLLICEINAEEAAGGRWQVWEDFSC